MPRARSTSCMWRTACGEMVLMSAISRPAGGCSASPPGEHDFLDLRRVGQHGDDDIRARRRLGDRCGRRRAVRGGLGDRSARTS